jgi:hypothetical protein
MRFLLLFMLVMSVARHAFGSPFEFTGTFTNVASQDINCDHIFAVDAYHAKHFLLGPTGRTSVLHLSGGEVTGFFDNIHFIGLYGGSQDLYYEKAIDRENPQGVVSRYEIVAQGFGDSRLFYLEFLVTRQADVDQESCQAYGVFSSL